MSDDPLVGQLLHDTHEVVRKIGQGGMGAVYEAVHKRLRKQKFAIKVLHQKMVENETVFARFQREAEIATEIGHPNIISVVDFYDTDDGLPCMVMEYLEGEDLGERIKRQGKLTLHEVVELLEQVGGALQAVHDKGVTHRDLKPANIFLTERPDGSTKVKVLDFGISKIRDSGTLTGDQAVLGTPHYMSPEQGEGVVKDVDHRTDIFALGTICYQVLSGKIPFDAPTLIGVIRSICDKPHEPVTAHVPGLNKQVDAVLNRALAKKKEDRYQRVGDFVRELKNALEGVAVDEEDELELDESVTATTAWQPAMSEDEAAAALAGKTAVLEDPSPPAMDAGEQGVPEEKPRRLTSEIPADPNITNVMGIDEVLGGAVVEPTAQPEEEAPPTSVSPHTTLSGAVGEQATGERRAPVEKKKLPAMAMAAAAVVVLALGGVYMATRGGGSEDRSKAAPPASVAAAPSRSKEPRKAPAVATAAPKREPAASPPVPTPGVQPAQKAEEAASPPAPKPTVAITLRLTPPSARVLLDGKVRKDNPLTLKKDGNVHKLRIEADGHQPAERSIEASTDLSLSIKLETTSKPARAAKLAKKRTRRRARVKQTDDDGYDDLESPKQKQKHKPKSMPKPKKKSDEDGYDNL